MRHRTIIMLAVLALIALASFPAAAANEEDGGNRGSLYQWTDERGVVHITDTLQSVPPEYRAGAQRIKPSRQEGGREEAGSPVEPPAEEVPEGDDEARKEEWQQRMREARGRLSAAEQRHREIEQELDALKEKWGHGSYGYTADVEAELKRLEEELQKARQRVDDARQEVEVAIPEQARKEGVPPGWLRE